MDTANLLAAIERFLGRHDIAESTFGRAAVNDWRFIQSLRKGRRVWPETSAKVLAFMDTYQAGHGDTDAPTNNGAVPIPQSRDVAATGAEVGCDRIAISQRRGA